MTEVQKLRLTLFIHRSKKFRHVQIWPPTGNHQIITNLHLTPKTSGIIMYFYLNNLNACQRSTYIEVFVKNIEVPISSSRTITIDAYQSRSLNLNENNNNKPVDKKDELFEPLIEVQNDQKLENRHDTNTNNIFSETSITSTYVEDGKMRNTIRPTRLLNEKPVETVFSNKKQQQQKDVQQRQQPMLVF